MAHKVLNSLLQDVHQVSKAIAADTLQQSETVRQVGEVLDALQATLKTGSARLQNRLSMRFIFCGQSGIVRLTFTANRSPTPANLAD